MHSLTISLPEPTYAAIEEAAAASGLSVEAVAAERLAEDFAEDDAVHKSLFAPAILAEIDAARAEAREGKNITMAEMRRQLAAQREAWLQNYRD